ncbi:hypothetical protein EDD17DRAFT_1559652 [Pisolithus thermaeus]|nr:hypothetical protein EV401DRAFT_1950318 [Pisolithus croceorrhizus]KAI6165080.1 hypothetical protein EDD17DRAFT_1559652 [Pisolithus thermaeus]
MDSTYQDQPQGSTSPCNNNDGQEDDNIRLLSERVANFAINLGRRVERDTMQHVTGAQAIIYRGMLQPEGTSVAVKTLRFGDKYNVAALKIVLREVNIWSKLQHSNVLPLLGITTEFDRTITTILSIRHVSVDVCLFSATFGFAPPACP